MFAFFIIDKTVITTSTTGDAVSVSLSSSKESNAPIIIGVVAGALVLVLACIIGALWISCRFVTFLMSIFLL